MAIAESISSSNASTPSLRTSKFLWGEGGGLGEAVVGHVGRGPVTTGPGAHVTEPKIK